MAVYDLHRFAVAGIDVRLAPNRGRSHQTLDVVQNRPMVALCRATRGEHGRAAVRYVRVYADNAGESHYQDVDVGLASRDFAPPAPPLFVSPVGPATGVTFVRFPAGWDGDWHPTPRRQFVMFLTGMFEGETSDGERRCFGPGSVVLLEDTTGRGHRSRVVGDVDVRAAVVQLPD